MDYGYDELNRLEEVSEPGGRTLGSYAYDALSRRSSLVYGNGVETTYAFEIDNDLANLAHDFPVLNLIFNYQYNKVHERKNMTATDNRHMYSPAIEGQDTYVANLLNQYDSVNGIGFTYDPNGNLTYDGNHN